MNGDHRRRKTKHYSLRSKYLKCKNSQQAEFTLGRKFTDRTWQQYTTSQKRKHKNIEDNVYSVEHLFHGHKEKLKPQFIFADVAKHAAKKAQRQQSRKQDNDFRVAKLFRDNKSSYQIEKIRSRIQIQQI